MKITSKSVYRGEIDNRIRLHLVRCMLVLCQLPLVTKRKHFKKLQLLHMFNCFVFKMVVPNFLAGLEVYYLHAFGRESND